MNDRIVTSIRISSTNSRNATPIGNAVFSSRGQLRGWGRGRRPIRRRIDTSETVSPATAPAV